jgi:hypothetical protein
MTPYNPKAEAEKMVVAYLDGQEPISYEYELIEAVEQSLLAAVEAGKKEVLEQTHEKGLDWWGGYRAGLERAADIAEGYDSCDLGLGLSEGGAVAEEIRKEIP